MEYGDLSVDNIHSTYIGRHIIRKGDRPQDISRAYDPMFECFHLNKELFDSNEVYVDRNITMSGCFKSNKETLQRTMIPEFDCDVASRPSIDKVKKFESSIKNAIRKLKITQLAKRDINDLDLVTFNKNTYPGFSLSEYCGHQNKNESAFDALRLAKIRWNRIDNFSKTKRKVQRSKIFPNTFVVGARNKRDFTYVDDDIITSRAVHMPEFHTEINSSVWITQITNALKWKERGPLYIGNSIYRYDRLAKDIADRNFCIEGDWKRFDSRLYITNIIIGVAILRLYFPLEDEEIDNHFIALFDTVAIKDYYTPGGYLYRIIHGLPSGVCSTSLLGSIINLVNLLYCTQDLPSKKLNFIVGGDDFLISISNSCNNIGNETLDKILKRAEEIGQVFKFLKFKMIGSDDVRDRPCFFKYTIDRGEGIVYPPSLLERVFLPWNKKYNSNTKILNFLMDLIPGLGAPRSSHLIFYDFYILMYYKVTGTKIKRSDIFSIHKDINSRIMQKGRFFFKEDNREFSSLANITYEDKSKGFSSYRNFLYSGPFCKKYKVKFDSMSSSS